MVQCVGIVCGVSSSGECRQWWSVCALDRKIPAIILFLNVQEQPKNVLLHFYMAFGQEEHTALL